MMPAEVIRERVQDGLTGETRDMQYSQCKIVGNGSFGVVFQTKLSPSGEDAAIKRVLQDKRFKVGLLCRSLLSPLLTHFRIVSCRSCASCGIRILSNSRHSTTRMGRGCVFHFQLLRLLLNATNPERRGLPKSRSGICARDSLPCLAPLQQE
jgi:hypothetical protein